MLRTLLLTAAVAHWAWGLPAAVGAAGAAAPDRSRIFRAGAYAIDITPTNFPVIVNAMFTERSADRAVDPLHTRCLVLDDGSVRLALAVVDSCMAPRQLLDAAKELAQQATGIPTDRIMISATHTHSAPSAMGCLGSRPDTNYQRFLPGQIAKGIELAARNLAPARVGWTVVQDYEHTYCRRWIRRPDKLLTDPFGVANVRANMHPGYQSPDVIGPSGPVDPALTILSVQTPAGEPLALLANYSMHYVGSPLLSADYYGRFAEHLAALVKPRDPNSGAPPFVGIMSQGTSGDQMWMNYGQAEQKIDYHAYAEAIAREVFAACRQIVYHDWAPLAMREGKLTLRFRVPDAARLAWARKVVADLNGRLPRTHPEIYAQEALFLHDRPTTELKLQAIRIGELGIAAIPDEVYAITGLKLKAQSPLQPTMNIELANGAEGYIPTPEQHRLGGYTTWPARTAGLEEQAEPKIVEAVLALLEQVAEQPRRKVSEPVGRYDQAVLDSRPAAYWRFNEFQGPTAWDATGHGQHGTYEGGVAFYLEGPNSPPFSSGGAIQRAAHFAGGRLHAALKDLGATYSVAFWFWNGLPIDARAVTGCLFSRSSEGARGDQVGVGGTEHSLYGRLFFANGNSPNRLLIGNTVMEPKTWNHLGLVRNGNHVAIYLNGNLAPDVSGEADVGAAASSSQVLVGDRGDRDTSFEGKMADVAVYSRALKATEVAELFKASGLPTKPLGPPPRAESEPKSPTESLAAMHLSEGFTVELVAAEPLVQSPVAIDWGADGRLWVIEMADYPMGMDGKMKPGGRLRVLESTHGDGHYDKSTLFMDGLNFPNGLITWRQGVIVTAAPDIFYAEDTDGDGKADKREVLFTGFNEGNLQLRVNGLRWGLDNWLYCANGWSGGVARSAKTGVKVDLTRRDLRIKPDEGLLELESGQSEFGRNRDDWGNWFGCDNSNPLFHFALEDRYLRRNLEVAAPDAKRQLLVPPNPRVYPRARAQKRYHSFEHVSAFTAACSADFYRDEVLFPRGPTQHAFVCEPVHNLIHQMLVCEDGTSFAASRAPGEEQSEFLASEDQWFRPVMVRTGPDGALWVVDMYRYMIEHPDWLPLDGKRELQPFYRAGADRGRICRIVPKGGKTRPVPRLDRLGTAQLVAELESPNGWVRDKAHQMLIWKADPGAVGPLERLVTASANPLARPHALWALAGLGALKTELLESALHDAHPAVRRQALRLAEPRGKGNPGLIEAALALTADPDAKVRQQLAYSLGEWDDPRVGLALGRLAVANTDDPYLVAAVMSSARNHCRALVEACISAGPNAMDTLSDPLLSLALALGQRDALARLLQPALDKRGHTLGAEPMRTFGHFLDILAHHNSSAEKLSMDHDDELARLLQRAPEIFAAAGRVAIESAQSESARLAAVELLGREGARQKADWTVLAQLLTVQTPAPVQLAAIKALGRIREAKVPDLFFGAWPSLAPEMLLAVVDECLKREIWTMEFLRRIECGEITLLNLDAARRGRLLKHRSEAIRSLAAKVLGANPTNPDRQKVIDQYRPALALPGEPRKGIVVFARLCITCHQLNGVGREIGPNLLSVATHAPERLLVSILDPSREVQTAYVAYNCDLADGTELYGLITSETGNSITLKLTDGTLRTFLRSEVKSLSSAKVSLMPDGLETGLTKQELADLIAYLRQPDIGNRAAE